MVALMLLGPSCTGQGKTTTPRPTTLPRPQPRPGVQPITDFSSFTAGLDAAGRTVRPGQQRRSPYLAVPGHELVIGDEPVWAYEFPTAKAFHKLRSTIRPRGDTIGTVIINWTDPPRFFGSGRLLILYFGDEQSTLESLEDLLGPQFAGGRGGHS